MTLDWLSSLMEKLQRLPDPAAPPDYRAERRALLQFLEGVDVSDPALETQVVEVAGHWDGYLREAAVRKLGAARSEAAFRALVKRLNDWVPQVRQAAAQGCANFLAEERADVLLACLDALLALSRGLRADHTGFLARVGEVIAGARNRSQVLNAFTDSRGAAARYLLARMLAWPAAERGIVAGIAARHRDFTVRSMLVKECERCDFPDQEALLRRLAADVHPKTRKAALGVLWNKYRHGVELAETVTRGLFDPAQTVRELALWCAERMGCDAAALLRQRVADIALGHRFDVGLIGLVGTMNAREYLPVIRDAFGDPRPKIRRAALAAWASLARDSADVPTVAALVDASAKVRKLALHLVRKGKVVLANEQLTDAADKAMMLAGLAWRLEIVRQLPFWERLEGFLGSLSHARTAAERQMVLAALLEWQQQQRYAFSSLPGERQEHLRACIVRSGLVDVLQDRQGCRFSLAQFGLLPDSV